MRITPVERTDLTWLKEQRNRPELRNYFRQHILLTDDDQEKWYSKKEMLAFIVWEKSLRIGYCAFSKIDLIAHKAEFSIFITPEKQGRGFGKQALLWLLKYGFDDLHLHQIYSDVITDNKALDIYVRMGFKTMGTFRHCYWKQGRYVDTVFISILKEEYDQLYRHQ